MSLAIRKRGAVRVAVVTGEHPFEVPEFAEFLGGLERVTCYLQDLENFSADFSRVQHEYEVVLFYNMHAKPPALPTWAGRTVEQALGELGTTSQGILVLHHGLLAFKDRPSWSEMVGIEDRSFTPFPGERLRVEIANPAHPVTKGLVPWEMVDETYAMKPAGAGSDILLTTSHARSVTTLAWTRRYRSSPVFCLASGHGRETYANRSFQSVVQRAIHWLAEAR